MRRNNFWKHFIILILCVVSITLICIPFAARATTKDVSTIEEFEEAINDDSCDTIVLKNSITLSTNTVINGGGKTVTAEVTGTNDQGIVQTGSNYSIFIVAAGTTATINDLNIKGGSTTAVVNNGTLYLNSVRITNSGSAAHAGGGIINNSGGYVVMKDSSIERNVALNGGGFKNYCGTFIFDNCSIVQNRSIGSGSNGGGGGENAGNQNNSSHPDAKLYMYNTTVANNTSSEIGGGINNCKNGYVYLMNCTVAGNATTATQTGFGGGIGNNDSYLYASNCVLTDNISVGSTEINGSDVGTYNEPVTTLYGCIYKEFSVTSAPPVTTDCHILTDEVIYGDTINGTVIAPDGSNDSLTFDQPAIITNNHKNLVVAFKTDSIINRESALYTYFEYSDLDNVVMAYKTEEGPITALGDLDASSITSIEEGNSIYGTGYVLAPGESIITIKVLRNVDISIVGGTIFGDSYVVTASQGQEITLVGQTAPNKKNYCILWKDEEGNIISSKNSYTFIATKNMTIDSGSFSFNATNADRKSVLSWTAIDGISEYKVYYSRENDFTTATEFTGTINTTGVTVTNLTSGSLYHYWVCLVVDDIVGDPAYANATTTTLAANKRMQGIAIETNPKLNYVEGQALDLSEMEIVVNYNDSTKEYIGFIDFASKNVTVSMGHNTILQMDDTGTKLTATYRAKTATTNALEVVERVVDNVVIKKYPTLSYIEYDLLDLSTLEVTLEYNDDSTLDVGYASFSANNLTVNLDNGILLAQGDSREVIVSYEDFSTSVGNLNVGAMEVDSISVLNVPTLTYIENTALDLTDLEVTITYNSRTKNIAYSDFDEFGITTSLNNTNVQLANNDEMLTVSCNGFTANVGNLVVIKKQITDLSIKTQPRLTYIETEPLDLSLLEVTVAYDNGQIEDYSFAEFEDNALSVSKENGVALTKADAEKIVITGGTKTVETQSLVINNRVLTGMSIKTQPLLQYIAGEELDLSAMVFTLSYNYGSTDVAYGDELFNSLITNATMHNGNTVGIWCNNTIITFYYQAFNASTEKLEVADKTITKMEVKTQPDLYYAEGESLDLSALVLKVTFNDKIVEEYTYANMTSIGITPSTWSGQQMTIAGFNGKAITFSKGDVSTSTNNLVVVEKAVVSIAVVNEPTLNYVAGQTLDLSNLTINVIYTDESEEEISFEDFEENGISVSILNDTVLTLGHNGVSIVINCNDKTAETSPLSIIKKELVSVSEEGLIKLDYIEGQLLDLSGIKVILSYNDTSTITAYYDDLDTYGITTNYSSGQILTLSDNDLVLSVSCGSITIEVGSLTVIPKILESISVKTEPTLNYIENQNLNLSGLVVILKYNDLTTEEIAFESFGTSITTNYLQGQKLTIEDNSQRITISKDGLNTQTNPLIITAKQVVNMEIKTPIKYDYIEEKKLDLTDLVVTVTYNNGEVEDIAYEDFGELITTNYENEQILSLEDNGKFITITCNLIEISTDALIVVAKQVINIAIISQPQLEYIEETTLDLIDLVISLEYDNGKKINVSYNDFDLYNLDIDYVEGYVIKMGDNGKQITISHGSLSTKTAPLVVSGKQVTNMVIKTQPKLDYIEGNLLDLTALIITITYDNGFSEDLAYKLFASKGIALDYLNNQVLALSDNNKPITLTCEEVIVYTNILVVSEKQAVSITLKSNPKINYIEGQNLDLALLSVTITYDNGDTLDVLYEDFDDSFVLDYQDGQVLELSDDLKVISITYMTFTCNTDSLNVEERIVTNIEVESEPLLSYIEGLPLNLDGLSIKIFYNDLSNETVAYENFDGRITINYEHGTVLTLADDEQVITVTCNGSSDSTNPLVISAKKMIGLTVKTDPQLNYIEGQALDLSIMVVTLLYDNGDSLDVNYDDFEANGITLGRENGELLALDDHNLTIKVSCQDKDTYTKALNIRVKQVVSIKVEEEPTLKYVEGQKLNLSSLIIKLSYDNLSTLLVPFNDFATMGITTSKTHEQTLELIDDETPIVILCNSLTCSTSLLIVEERAVNGITIKTNPNLSYVEGQKLDLSALVVILAYNDATTEEIAFSEFNSLEISTSLSNEDVLALSNDGTKITVSCNGYNTMTNALSIEEKVLRTLVVKKEPTLKYIEGQSLNITGLIVTLTYNDGEVKDLAFTEFVEYVKTDYLNNQVLSLEDNGEFIKITCEGIDAYSKALEVSKRVVSKVTIKNEPNLEYVEGQILILSGLVVTLEYNDTQKEDVSFADFGSRISISITDGVVLKTSDNGYIITVSSNGIIASLSALQVVEKIVNKIILIHDLTVLEYVEGQALVLDGLVVELAYNDGETKQVSADMFSLYGITVSKNILSLSDNEEVILITCNELEVSTCAISVIEKAVSNIEVKSQATKSYIEGQALVLTDLVVTLSYNDGSSKDVSYSQFTAYDITASMTHGELLTIDDNGLVIEIACNGYKTSLQALTVIKRQVTSIALVTEPKLQYYEGQTLDLSALIIALTYNDLTNENVEYASFGTKITTSMSHGVKLSLSNNEEIIISCDSYTTKTSSLVIIPKEVISISVKTNPRLEYVVGQTLNLQDLVVTLTYNDSDVKDVAFSQFNTYLITSSMENGTTLPLTYNDQTITITCNGKTATTGKLIVADKEVTNIVVTNQPSLSYIEGQSLDLTGLIVTLTYNDLSTKQVAYADFEDFDITVNPDSLSTLEISDNGLTICLTCNGAVAYSEGLVITLRTIDGISINENPKLTYIEGQALDLTDLIINLHYNDESNVVVSYSEFTDKEITTSILHNTILALADDNKQIKVAFDDFYCYTDYLVVNEKEIEKIVVLSNLDKLSYVEGQSLDLTGLAIRVLYNNDSFKDIDYLSFTLNGVSVNKNTLVLTDNGKTVTISYQGFETETDELVVYEKQVIDIEIIVYPKRNYIEEETLDLSKMTVRLTYNDETVVEGLYSSFGALVGTNIIDGMILSLENNDMDLIVSCNENEVSTKISVVSKSITGIEVITDLDKYEYVEGQSLDLTGLEIKISYNNSTSIIVDSSEFTENAIGISIAEGTVLKTTDSVKLTITKGAYECQTRSLIVSQKVINGIRIISDLDKLSYVEGQSLDLQGLIVELSYNDGDTKEVNYLAFTANEITVSKNILALEDDGYAVVIRYHDYSANTSSIEVVAKMVNGISVKTQPLLEYIEGQTIDLSALMVTLSYNDGDSQDVAYLDFSDYEIAIDDVSVLSISNNGLIITVTCNEHDASLMPLIVKEKVVTSIIVSSDPTKMTYVVGQSIILNGLSVTLTYNDGDIIIVNYSDFEEYNIFVEDKGPLDSFDNGANIMVECNEKKGYTSALSVIAKKVIEMEIIDNPLVHYVEGQTLDLSDLKIQLTYNDGDIKEVEFNDFITYKVDVDEKSNLTLDDNGLVLQVSCDEVSLSLPALEVVSKVVNGISIISDIDDLSYIEGQNLNLEGLVVELSYNDGDAKEVSYLEFSAYSIMVNKSTLALEDDGLAVEISCNGYKVFTAVLEVIEKEVSRINVIDQPKISYIVGQNLDLSELKVRLTYNDGEVVELMFEEFGILVTTSMANGVKLTADDNGKVIEIACGMVKESTSSLLIVDKKAVSMEVKDNPRLSYVVNEALDLSNLVVTVHYNDFTEEDVPYSRFGSSIVTSLSNGTILLITNNDQEITITYGALVTKTGALDIKMKHSITLNTNQQNYAYDGNFKSFNLNSELSFVVKYYSDDFETEVSPLEAGAYNIIISRAEDDIYEAYYKQIENGLVITLASIIYRANGYDGTYDGSNHYIDLSIDTLDVLIKYSLDGVNYSYMESPALKNVGTKTIFYRIEKANYQTIIGSADINIVPKAITVFANDISAKPFEDLELTYRLSEVLYANDVVNGSLARIDGNTAGTYEINQGTLSISNYEINFICGTYTVRQQNLVSVINDEKDVLGSLVIDYGVDPNSVLVIKSIDNCNIDVPKNKEEIGNYNVSLQLNGLSIQPEVIMKVRLTVDEDLINEKKIQVALIEDGETVIFDVTVDKNTLSFETKHLGDFVIIGEAQTLMDRAKNAVLTTLMVFLIIVNGVQIVLGGYIMKKILLEKKLGQIKTYSFAPVVLAAATINNGTFVAVVILAILAILQSLALAYGCYMLMFKKKDNMVANFEGQAVEKPVVSAPILKEPKEPKIKEPKEPKVKEVKAPKVLVPKEPKEPKVKEVKAPKVVVPKEPKEPKVKEVKAPKTIEEKPKTIIETKPIKASAEKKEVEEKSKKTRSSKRPVSNYVELLASAVENKKREENKYKNYVEETPEEPVKKKRSNSFVQGTKTKE